MTVEEAREIFGLRKGEVALKAGLTAFKKAYKKLLKDPNTPPRIAEIIRNDLEAVDVLINESR